MERSAKRARANTRGDTIAEIRFSPRQLEAILNLIDAMPTRSHTMLLTNAAIRDAQLAAEIKDEYERLRANAAARAISFDHYRLDAWRELNMNHEHMSTRARAQIGP